LQDDKLPSLSVKTIKGKDIDLKSFQGKPILIHFWATWCPVCKMETANIERVSKKYQVISIAVNSGDDESIKAFMREQDAGFQVINDTEGELSRQFSVEVFPTTFIYDGSGKLLFSEVGYTSTAGLLGRMAWAEKK
jgi:thiol-disulfide isomerase/thioredoxin